MKIQDILLKNRPGTFWNHVEGIYAALFQGYHQLIALGNTWSHFLWSRRTIKSMNMPVRPSPIVIAIHGAIGFQMCPYPQKLSHRGRGGNANKEELLYATARRENIIAREQGQGSSSHNWQQLLQDWTHNTWQDDHLWGPPLSSHQITCP